MLTNRYKSAMQFAATVHDGHLRKGTQVAYLSHLMSVSALVIEDGGNEHEAIAALLHDAIEDRGNAYESPFQVEPRTGREALKRDIELQFGTEVLSIVRQCTDDEYLPAGRASEKGSPAEWRVRKTAYLESLRKKTDVSALRVSCADKLHNARATLADYETEGERLWQRFNVKSMAEQLWYYEGLAGAFVERSEALGDAGLQRVSISLDGASAASHDDLRAVPGAFEGALRGIAAFKQAGLPFQINTTITKNNLAELPAIYELAISLGAAAHHVFVLVSTGRGAEMVDQLVSPQE